MLLAGAANPLHWSCSGSVFVLNSAKAAWRLALRAVAYQAIATLAIAAACVPLGSPAVLAALAGGGAMTLGSLVAAWGALGGGVAGAGKVLARLLLGLAAKWLVVLAGLYLAMAVWQLPALPALGAAAIAAAAWLVSTRFVTNRSTTRANA